MPKTATKAAPDTERAPVPLDDLASPAALARQYPDNFTETGLRWAIRQRHRNGLSTHGAVLMVRGRAMFVKSRFERWLADQVA
ncbi:MAG: hypothetical protein MUF80_09480 [Burkholderiales bacterium]|jgi:hypothetical protein|nr:hypothetical protein [Burkholderiales bacterium]